MILHPSFKANYYPNIEEETKAKILQLQDPAENLKTLDTNTVEDLTSKDRAVLFWKEVRSDEESRIFRIFSGNNYQICELEDLYSNVTDLGLYYMISLINHSCVPNAIRTWVMGDFRRHQVRAIKTIEKDEEILISYRDHEELVFGSKEFRQRHLLEALTFLCQCAECSLEGEALEENERMRMEIREKKVEITRLLRCDGSVSLQRKSWKKAMKLEQQRVKLIQRLDIRAEFVKAMIDFYHAATWAGRMGIPRKNDPEVFKKEARKYAEMFGGRHIFYYSGFFQN